MALARQDRDQVFTRSAGVEAGFRRFRRFASIVMNNDGAAFVVLCALTRNTLPGALPPALLIAAGILLILLGVSVKVWAAWRLGGPAYYWHNFFASGDPIAPDPPGPYRFMQNPMYTVGYLQTYGLALTLGSAPGLAASAFAQTAILIFHHLVEKPHYERLIGANRDRR